MQHPKPKHGFTLIEMMVVLSLIALLASIVAPVVYKSVQRAHESALRETLRVTRHALDDYYADKQHYPDSLEVLVKQRYLRTMPVDEVVGSDQDWVLVRADNSDGIINLHSSSDKTALDGTKYSDW